METPPNMIEPQTRAMPLDQVLARATEYFGGDSRKANEDFITKVRAGEFGDLDRDAHVRTRNGRPISWTRIRDWDDLKISRDRQHVIGNARYRLNRRHGPAGGGYGLLEAEPSIARKDIDRCYPRPTNQGGEAPESEVTSTGAPGRPTSMHLVLAEFARRHKAGQTEPSRTGEGEALAAWLKKKHSKCPQPTAKTISNNLPRSFQPQACPK
jgi:hypothetical protein